MRKLLIFFGLLSLASVAAAQNATGLALTAPGLIAATQANVVTSTRNTAWAFPGAGIYVLSYPTVPPSAGAVSWADAQLQFRQWSLIPATYGVEACTLSLAPGVVMVPGSSTDPCGYGVSASKVFLAKSLVAVAPTPVPPPVVVPPVGPTATTATVNWLAPTTNTNGTPLTNLASFNLYMGASAGTLAKIAVVGPGVLTYTTGTLAAGTYWFTVTAVSGAGVESTRPAAVSAVITGGTVPPPPPTKLITTCPVPTAPGPVPCSTVAQ